MDLLTQPVAQKLVKNQEQINQLHEVLSTLRLDKQNAMNRRLVRKTQDGTLGQPDTGDAAVEDEDETVSFGDTTNTYNVAGQAKDTIAKAAPSVLPYVLAAALGGTGLGAAAMALPSVLKLLNPPAATQALDFDTKYNLNFEE
jgi:hypothetical protein